MSTTKKTAQTTPVEEEATQDTAIIAEDLDRIVPEPGEPIKLEDGTQVVVRPLKLKELFAAFKVITRGSAQSMGSINLGAIDDEDFSNTLIALLLFALPEAPEEFSEFLRVIVDPVVPAGGWPGKDAQFEAEVHLDEILLGDPAISDAIDIITAMVYAESQDIQRLGKKIANAVAIFTKVQPKK